jgi:predicted outer membrane lipoprotein
MWVYNSNEVVRCPKVVASRSNLGLKLANAFGVIPTDFSGFRGFLNLYPRALANARNLGLRLANAFGATSK